MSPKKPLVRVNIWTISSVIFIFQTFSKKEKKKKMLLKRLVCYYF